MKINNLTLDEILHYGMLGEVDISSPDEWGVLSQIIDARIEDVSPTEEDIDDRYDEGFDDGEDVGYDKGWADCVKHYDIEE